MLQLIKMFEGKQRRPRYGFCRHQSQLGTCELEFFYRVDAGKESEWVYLFDPKTLKMRSGSNPVYFSVNYDMAPGEKGFFNDIDWLSIGIAIGKNNAKYDFLYMLSEVKGKLEKR